MIKPLVHNVVVAVNGSESSVHAAMYGIILSKLYHYNLKFVYVVDTDTIKRLSIGKFLLEEESAGFASNLHSDGEKYLDYVMNLAKQKGVKAQSELLEGNVWGELIHAAEKFKAELILLGSEIKKTGFASSSSSASFSIAEKEIILHARCSVMIVREPKIEQLFRIS